ncbi:MAG TPA: SusC/RagA family TonB-linked outer membrane protein [Saprospiraceae bacterium]|nr:SusC/RagA family TonB-linked outer membrane protein [Saprospiraceae bacterium]
MKYHFTKAGLLLALLLWGFTASAQFMVTGSVKSANNEPLIGVSVVVKGTTRGTVSDFDGNFRIEVPGESATLMLSYTGFKTREVAVSSGNNTVAVVLDEDIARLDEIVVTGLASGVKRANSGNAVTSISADELTGGTTPQTIDNALYGKIPGVQMTANSGAPGGGINVQLRGVSTLGAGSSQPLYIIDGVYVDNSTIRNGRTQVSGAGGGASGANQDDAANRIADINPDDIERIEVLKGPSAAAIYGTRANAGVIIITTKRGTAGKTRVSLSQDIGMAQAQNLVGLEGWNEDKINLYYTGARRDIELQRYRDAVAENRVTDWEKDLYGETALLSNTQLSLSGGNDRTQFFASSGYQNEDGIIKNTGYERFNLRANVDHKITNGIKVAFNNNYTRSFTARGFTGNQNNTGGSIGYTLANTPTYANLRPDANGNYPVNPYFNDNPLAIRDLGTNDERVDRFISAIAIDVDLYQGSNAYLKFRVNGGLDYLSGNTLIHFPEILQHQRATANPGDVMWGRQDNFNLNAQGFFIFNTNLGSINSNTTAGMVRLDQRSNYQLTRGRGLSAGQQNLNWARVQSVESQVNQEVTDIGFVVQEDLNWEDKIIVSAGVRFDKSTLNAQQDKYYAFPKVSLAANIANFDFWSLKNTINQFKIRGAYGETGGLPNFGVTFESLTSQLIGGRLGTQVSTRGVDPNLVPETAAELEFGVDLGFFNNRITLEATYYNKVVRNLILDLVPASSTGITNIATNAADLENRGFELGLGITPIRSNNVNWNTRLLYWQNRSEITDLRVPVIRTGGFGIALGQYLIAEGYSPTTVIGNPANPNIPGNATIYGDRQPDFQMSWFNQITLFKNLDFNFLLHYQEGGVAINLNAFLWDTGGTSPDWSVPDVIQNADGSTTQTVRGRARAARRAAGDTGVYIDPTSYLKLREVGLYYTLPKGIFGQVVDRARIGVSANNLLLWTNYTSYDPEVSNFGVQPINGGVEVANFPSSRRLFAHLKFDF